MEEKKHEDYPFLQETIKDEVKDARKTGRFVLSWVLRGLILGSIASLVFAVSKPLIDKYYGGDAREIKLAEEIEAEPGEDPGADTSEEAPVTSEEDITQKKNKIANQTFQSLVTIYGIKPGESWSVEAEQRNTVSGVILGENSEDILIFASVSVMRKTTDLRVTFVDGSTYKGFLKMRDGVTEMGIFTVRKDDMEESTKSAIAIAKLGSSKQTKRGEEVILAGNPFGYSEGVGFGIISAIGESTDLYDGTYSLLHTDILTTKEGTGVMVNMSGEIIGLLAPRFYPENTKTEVTGFGITDIKGRAEKLLNMQNVPYIGIVGAVTTEEMVAAKVPEGVYVGHVGIDSPAMHAGIQKGDVLQKIGKTEIKEFADYTNALLKVKPGKNVVIEGARLGQGGEYVSIEYTVTVGTKETK
ncbi:S1C family serine protease [Ohessyouella blattaphilus]|uniref:S1C family serine protease n=1 Tax=Ohessyouella blattaphilus TaxID=2949333 RepID=A0ABT1EKI7_9FIRM|nr:S1C family serine protease [Ohessyouella blattaphilus]MCP1110277.1 S1C family serine protease [Ohessyouella blattaphilus]MCR8563671.1 S1C family serine protease [Ohessyouella blattaphilus]